LTDMDCADLNRETTQATGGQLYDVRKIVTLSRFPIVDPRFIRDSSEPRPRFQMATADPEDMTSEKNRGVKSTLLG